MDKWWDSGQFSLGWHSSQGSIIPVITQEMWRISRMRGCTARRLQISRYVIRSRFFEICCRQQRAQVQIHAHTVPQYLNGASMHWHSGCMRIVARHLQDAFLQIDPSQYICGFPLTSSAAPLCWPTCSPTSDAFAWSFHQKSSSSTSCWRSLFKKHKLASVRKQHGAKCKKERLGEYTTICEWEP